MDVLGQRVWLGSQSGVKLGHTALEAQRWYQAGYSWGSQNRLGAAGESTPGSAEDSMVPVGPGLAECRPCPGAQPGKGWDVRGSTVGKAG